MNDVTRTYYEIHSICGDYDMIIATTYSKLMAEFICKCLSEQNFVEPTMFYVMDKEHEMSLN